MLKIINKQSRLSNEDEIKSILKHIIDYFKKYNSEIVKDENSEIDTYLKLKEYLISSVKSDITFNTGDTFTIYSNVMSEYTLDDYRLVQITVKYKGDTFIEVTEDDIIFFH